jgi:hypothetical protein
VEEDSGGYRCQNRKYQAPRVKSRYKIKKRVVQVKKATPFVRSSVIKKGTFVSISSRVKKIEKNRRRRNRAAHLLACFFPKIVTIHEKKTQTSVSTGR